MEMASHAAILATYFTAHDVARGAARAFSLDLRLGVATVLDTALVLLLALSPTGRALYDRCRRLPRPWLGDAAFLALVELCRSALALPLDWEFDLRNARALGLSHETFARFLSLAGRDALFGAAAFALIGATLPFVRAKLPKRWWLALAVAGSIVLVADVAMDPYRVELDYKLTPLAPGPLRTRIDQLIAATNARVGEVVEANVSKDSTEANAYVMGFGPTKRLVLTDNLLALGDDAVVGAVAHEIGHRRDRKLPFRLALSMGGLFALLWLLERTLRFGLAHGARSTAQALPLFIAVFTLLNVASLPVRAAISRHDERAADTLELKTRKDLDAYVQEQVELTRRDALEPDPGGFDRLLSTHPSPVERIARALWYKARRGSGR